MKPFLMMGMCIGSALLAVACVASSDAVDYVSGQDYIITIKENFALKRFELELKNLRHDAICMSNSIWPDRDGYLFAGDQVANLTDAGVQYPALYLTSTAHCVRNCKFKVDPGASLKGFIDFSVFEDPALSAPSSDRQLHYRGVPIHCD